MQQIIDRFLKYVKIDTQSNADSDTVPSTEKQWNLAHELFDELQEIGMEEVSIDDNGYVMATLPGNVSHDIPTIGFIAHYDTSPDFTAENVHPQIVEDYDGGDIVLNAIEEIVLSPDYFTELGRYTGKTLITTDGTTLLGADDKAGVAEIVTAMAYLIDNPDIRHGRIRVCFTPDEEIGRGAHHFDVEKFGAAWAYTIDGGQLGELQYENFNAARAKVTIKGRSVHPGYAKNKMVNAISIATDFLGILPPEERPERTEGRQGFFHVHHFSGTIELAEFELIIRDHDREQFENRKQLIQNITESLNRTHGDCLSLDLKDQYYNMREKVEPVYHIVAIAKEAMESVGVEPIIKPIRGGTDGSQLSFKGLPCPNIFAGGHNFHGKYEYVPVESMQKAVETIVKICELVGRKSDTRTSDER